MANVERSAPSQSRVSALRAIFEQATPEATPCLKRVKSVSNDSGRMQFPVIVHAAVAETARPIANALVAKLDPLAVETPLESASPASPAPMSAGPTSPITGADLCPIIEFKSEVPSPEDNWSVINATVPADDVPHAYLATPPDPERELAKPSWLFDQHDAEERMASASKAVRTFYAQYNAEARMTSASQTLKTIEETFSSAIPSIDFRPRFDSASSFISASTLSRASSLSSVASDGFSIASADDQDELASGSANPVNPSIHEAFDKRDFAKLDALWHAYGEDSEEAQEIITYWNISLELYDASNENLKEAIGVHVKDLNSPNPRIQAAAQVAFSQKLADLMDPDLPPTEELHAAIKLMQETINPAPRTRTRTVTRLDAESSA